MRLYVLLVEGLTLHFNSFEAAYKAEKALKSAGFSVESLNDYPVALYSEETVDQALEAVNAFCGRS